VKRGLRSVVAPLLALMHPLNGQLTRFQAADRHSMMNVVTLGIAELAQALEEGLSLGRWLLSQG
jgi:hypothetical protein